MDIPLDEVIYVEAISSSSTGAAADADSTPTFAVYEEATDTDIGVGGNMTKRTSLTGDYRASFTASAANGFELGKWYVVIGSATIGAIACKGVLARFRIVAAELVAGYPPADVLKISGDSTAADNAESFFDGTGYAGTNNVIPLVTTTTTATNVTTVNGLAANVITAASAAADFGAEIQALITGGAYALSTDANGRMRIVDGTGAGELDTLSGTVLLRAATQSSIDAIEADTNELQTDWANGGRLDLLIDAIKAKTDQLVFGTANRVNAQVYGMESNTLTAAAAATDFGAEIQALITGGAYDLDTDANGRIRIVDGTAAGELDTALGLVKISGTLQTLDALNNLSAAQVNAEVVDVLNVDTFAEPSQGAPGATITLAAKLGWLFSSWRNKKDNDGSTTNLYADNGSTVIAKQATSVLAGTVTKAEWITGA